MTALYKNCFMVVFCLGLILSVILAKAQAAPSPPPLVVPQALGARHAHRSVIHISRAQRLNRNKKLISDITKQTRVKDNVYATIRNGEYVRVTFEQVLGRNDDNAIYARPSSPHKPATIEVYPVYTDQHGAQIEFPKIATFPSISYEGSYKVLLTHLLVPTKTFDFKITGHGVDIDYIVDPAFTFLESIGSLNYGSGPFGSLILSGSTLYGMTNFGGSSNVGIIYSVGIDGSGFTVLYNFTRSTTDGSSPYGSLALSGSTLYGMTYRGGSSGEGIIFSIATTGGALTDLHDFSGGTDGFSPSGSLILSGSTLYGMTSSGGASGRGIIFSIATTGGTLTDLHDFSGSTTDGASPQYGSLLISVNTLYGMTSSGGASSQGIIFSIATTGGALTDLHDFSGSTTDGSSPFSSLTLSGGTLYGMTSSGGASGYGIVFSIATTGGTLTDLHNFSGSTTDGADPDGSLVLSGSTLYGMTSTGGAGYGIVFSIATTGGTLTDLHNFSGSTTDGADPYSSLTLSGSTLYGVTNGGGASGNGIVFSMATTGGTLTDTHDFSGSTNGSTPYGSLTLSGSTLYGMTTGGGALGKGIIFSMAATGGTLTDLHDFSGSITDGANPYGSLTLSGSTLYGMTELGGSHGLGIIFSIATTGGTLTDLHNFSGSTTDGSDPEGSLVLSGSKLYGMANGGGSRGLGIIFSIATTGGTLTDLHNFSGSATDGQQPQFNSLILSGSTLYGMTTDGGALGDGIIFSMAMTGGTLTDLHDFSGTTTDGAYPYGSLTLSGSTLYGMTSWGGSYGKGIIFSMATTGGTLTDLQNFSGSTNGSTPYSSLTLSGSTLYGMTSAGGSHNVGIIFSMATTGGTLTDLHDFSGSTTDGSVPDGSLVLSGSTLYGMTQEGGSIGLGAIFLYSTTASSSDGFYYGVDF